jgi:hypothetical protein
MKKAFILGLMLYCSCLYCQEIYVTIDKQKYYVKEFGKGDITIIFENGMSDSLEIWGAIPDSVAKYARVFLYDRIAIIENNLLNKT